MSKPVIFTISATWDDVASVWTGHCDDIPMAADAPTPSVCVFRHGAGLLPGVMPAVSPSASSLPTRNRSREAEPARVMAAKFESALYATCCVPRACRSRTSGKVILGSHSFRCPLDQARTLPCRRTCQPTPPRYSARGTSPAGVLTKRNTHSGNCSPRRRRGDHRAVRRQRLDGELVGVHFAGRRRRADKARGEGVARHFRLAAIADRAAAVMKCRFVEIGHGEAQIDRPARHVAQRKIRRAVGRALAPVERDGEGLRRPGACRERERSDRERR